MIAAIALSVTLILVCGQVHLLGLFPWPDEAETIVAARLMASGGRLYSDVFEQHGPLGFLPGYLLACLGAADVVHCRIVMIAAQWLALLACSRLISDDRSASVLWLGFSAAWIVCLTPYWFGQAYLYQTLAGVLLAVALSTLCLPCLLAPIKFGPISYAVGGFCLACLPFLAFTYDLTAALLLVAALRSRSWRPMLLGAFVALSANLAWLLLAGNLTGYIVDHYYINLWILPHFLGHIRPSHKDILAAGVTISVITLTALDRLASRIDGWRVALLWSALILLFARGINFQAEPACYCVLPLTAMLLRPRAWLKLPATGPPLLGLAISLLTLLTWRPAWVAGHRSPGSTTFARFVDANTQPGDRIISYSFQNQDYLLSNRLPATADFFLLPSQIHYDKRPILGFRLDVCERLARAAPKIIKLDRWNVYGANPWSSYGGCVDRFVQTHYRPASNDGVYVRNDVTLSHPWPDAEMRR